MRFLTESHLNQPPTPEIFALIPAETQRGLELDAQGVRLNLFVAADQSRAWQVLRGDSLEQIEQIMATFPLHPYVSVTITPLAEMGAGG